MVEAHMNKSDLRIIQSDSGGFVSAISVARLLGRVVFYRTISDENLLPTDDSGIPA